MKRYHDKKLENCLEEIALHLFMKSVLRIQMSLLNFLTVFHHACSLPPYSHFFTSLVHFSPDSPATLNHAYQPLFTSRSPRPNTLSRLCTRPLCHFLQLSGDLSGPIVNIVKAWSLSFLVGKVLATGRMTSNRMACGTVDLPGHVAAFCWGGTSIKYSACL